MSEEDLKDLALEKIKQDCEEEQRVITEFQKQLLSDYVPKSELREWCEDRILSLELEENLCHYDFGVIFAYKDILNKFCGGKHD